jgi:hypothetical protein
MKLHGWYRIGIVISVIWLGISSFVYFQGIRNYPSKYTNIVNHNYYEWVPDTQEKKEVELEELPPFPEGFEPIKPTFRILGYLAFVFVPAVVVWVVTIVGIFVVRWVYAGFKT